MVVLNFKVSMWSICRVHVHMITQPNTKCGSVLFSISDVYVMQCGACPFQYGIAKHREGCVLPRHKV